MSSSTDAAAGSGPAQSVVFAGLAHERLGYHETPVRVPFGFVDAYGCLWHGHAASYFEMARADLVRPFGLSAADLARAGLLVPMLELHCEYRKQAFDDEELVVQSTLLRPERPLPHLAFEYHIVRVAGGDEVLRGHTRQLLTHREKGVLIRAPAPVREALERIYAYLDARPRWPAGG